MTEHAIVTTPGPLPRHVRLLRRLGRARPGPYQVGFTGGLRVPGADGTMLLTDHYEPLGEGSPGRVREPGRDGFPTLLVRTPYGRGFPFASLYGSAYAQYGFHVLLQSCRGTAGSSGEFTWYRDDAADGLATVAWLREQPWFTGELGMTGLSYLGFAQWALAQDPPPELRAMVIQAAVHDPYETWYQGGGFALENWLVAGAALVHQGRGALRFLSAAVRLQRKLPKVVTRLPLIDTYKPAVGQRVPFMDQMLLQSDRSDPIWDGTDVGAVAERLTIPTMLVAGWYDLLLDQNLVQYERLRRAGCPTTLLVGPWTHASMLEAGGPTVLAASVGWLRAHLAGDDSGLPRSRVRVHVGGADEWRDLADWPPPATTTQLYLHNGRLEAGAPSTDGPIGSYRYDPADPTPSVGGPTLARSAGSRDNTRLEARRDVLTFTTDALTEPVEVMGPVSVRLRVGAKAGSHIDVFARLCDVDESGRSLNVCDGLLRLPEFDRDGSVEVTVAMSSTAHQFRTGHRIRLQVSGGAHPRFARNTGTGEPLATASRLVATDVSIGAGSVLLLPATSP
jgi:putative CocE/NonD family hydrolase